MKFLLSLLLALLVPALGRFEIEIDENGERRLKTATASKEELASMEKAALARDSFQRRLFTAGEAKSITAESPEAAFEQFDQITIIGLKHCFYIRLIAFVKEIVYYAKENQHGMSYYFPIYDADTLKKIGTYTEESIYTHYDECVINGVYNFDYNEEFDTWDSAITTSASCTNTFNAITGGTGQYACATGFQALTDDVDQHHFVSILLYMCHTPCIVP